MPFLPCRCGRFNVMGRSWEDDDGYSGEALGVVRSSPRRGWLPLNVAVSGDALCCTVVCPGLGITFIALIHEGWFSCVQEYILSDLTGLRLLLDLDSTTSTFLMAIAYLARHSQILATAAAKLSDAGYSRLRLHLNVARTVTEIFIIANRFIVITGRTSIWRRGRGKAVWTSLQRMEDVIDCLVVQVCNDQNLTFLIQFDWFEV